MWILAFVLSFVVALAGYVGWRLNQAHAQLERMMAERVTDEATHSDRVGQLNAELSDLRRLAGQLEFTNRASSDRLTKLDLECSNLRSRFGMLVDAEAERACFVVETDRIKIAWDSEKESNALERSNLQEEYSQAKARYDALCKEVRLLEENLEDISFGVYRPHFTFQTSDEYKREMIVARDRAKEIVRAHRATLCPIRWTVSESLKDGDRMVKQYTKLQLRAFNGECDAALANVTWNNVLRMEERIRKCFQAINDLGSVTQVSITSEYLDAKIVELRLSHEFESKKYEEREEQRRQREELRQEERAQQEFDSARLEAEAEEERCNTALERTRIEAENAAGAQLERLTEKISSLESKIDEARNKKEKAVSRAQLTKSGFVYVISNIGSFGEKVYKIGMTRRMEPMDRVDELGSASVPFRFDLHAMMYSDNAPALEGALHDHFEDRRLNKVNRRKEFYTNIELSEIQTFVSLRGLSAQFNKTVEAREYRETLALVEADKTAQSSNVDSFDQFPNRLFESIRMQQLLPEMAEAN